MSYAIMRAEKLKSHQIHFSQNHNERNHKNYSNPDINLEKTKDNYHLIESKNYSRDTEHIIQKNYKGTKNIRKDAVKNIELIFTSDKDFFDKLSPVDERKFFEESLKFTQEYFGEKNIFSAVVHKDETTPHMHVNLVPIKDGKLSAKIVIGNRKNLENMQDEFYKKISKTFPELERGKKKEITNALHLDLQEYKKQSIKKIEKDIEIIEKRKEKIDNSINEYSQKWSGHSSDNYKIKAIYKNAKPQLLGTKVLVEREDLRFVTNKAYKTFIADERAREFARENSRIKTENYDLREENKTVRNLKAQMREKNNDYDRLETKNYILNSDINALKKEKEEDKKILNDFLKQYKINGKSLNEHFKEFKEKLEKTVSKAKVRTRSKDMER